MKKQIELYNDLLNRNIPKDILDNTSENNGNGNEDTGNSKYNYGKGD